MGNSIFERDSLCVCLNNIRESQTADGGGGEGGGGGIQGEPW